ncbi:putative transcription factor C2H2 family [Helianthus debilis subsp. tardiflorus]
MEGHDGGDTMIMGVMTSHMKGKRTKRRRPSSALSLTLASTSSSTTTTTSETSASANHNGLFRMPSTTSIEFTNILQDNHTNNDQDIANCLMLLAHGHHLPPPPRSYVYECKTCDRGFPSFQALGGHRASHNKPHKDVHELPKNKTSILTSPHKPLSCNPSGSGSTKGIKVHECSICGSEFTSGQALGGHMRRHRSMTMANTTSNGHRESKKHKTAPSLDLNLPAPMEDEHKEITNNSFGSNNQIIVFSASPALVDCHF